MKKIYLILLFCIIVNINCVAGKNEAKSMKISKEKAIQIANQEAVHLGYDISKMKIEADEKNTLWNWYISRGPVLTENPSLRRNLENKNFCAIHYNPEEIQFGGDLWIFVDKETGEIITTIQGK